MILANFQPSMVIGIICLFIPIIYVIIQVVL